MLKPIKTWKKRESRDNCGHSDTFWAGILTMMRFHFSRCNLSNFCQQKHADAKFDLFAEQAWLVCVVWNNYSVHAQRSRWWKISLGVNQPMWLNWWHWCSPTLSVVNVSVSVKKLCTCSDHHTQTNQFFPRQNEIHSFEKQVASTFWWMIRHSEMESSYSKVSWKLCLILELLMGVFPITCKRH